MSDQESLFELEAEPEPGSGDAPGADGPGAATGAGARFSALEVSRALGQEHPPTPEQAAVIEAPLRAQLVVAGAGSGKTETMTARVVWLVANGFVEPDEVLGLTFTRKAAGELADRVAARLGALAASGLWAPPSRDESGALTLPGSPTVTTYHSYAGQLVREHGPMLGRERDARLLTEAAAWQLAHEAVLSYDGAMEQVDWVEPTVTRMVVGLAGELAEHLRSPEEVADHLRDLVRRWEAVELADKPLALVTTVRNALRDRTLVLPVVRRYLDLKHERGVLDFSDQMALAARLAQEIPEIGEAERSRYRVVLLDEFQDTSEAQLVLMTSLFAPEGQPPAPVTAVGDPHQSIYAWRGASATTLATFPKRFGGAPVLHLSTSWRNDEAILAAANTVAEPLREGSAVPVRPLAARPGGGGGRVGGGGGEDAARAAALGADWIAERRGDGRRSAAVLCRKRSQFTAIVTALAERGVPHEVVGLGGLLVTPEVADVIALLTVVQDPARGDRLMRLLTGPVCRLGAADIAGLAAWAREGGPPRARSAGVDLAPDSREERTIIDALDDLPDVSWRDRDGARISEEALVRLGRLAATVTRMRRMAGQPLPDLVVEAERALGVDIEVLARPGWTAGAARAHLDAFADVAAQFAAGADRATLGGFIDWVEAAIAEERGLDRPVVDPTPDAVQILTCHAAKGLEWDVVAVPGLVEATFPSHSSWARWNKSSPGWVTNEPKDSGWLQATEGGMPYPLRGDRDGLPELSVHGATTKEINEAIGEFKRASGRQALTEERRLAYVAFTRARQHLLVTSAVWSATGKTPRLPSRFFEEVAALPGVHLLSDTPMPEVDAVNPLLDQTRSVVWPTPVESDARPGLENARGVVEQPGRTLDTTHPLDGAIELLLAERDAARRPGAPTVPLPAHLSTSSLVSLARDEDDFASRLRRPMPEPPSRALRRGTTFHAWVEQHYGAAAMVDVLDLPGRADTAVDDPDLPELQERFLASEWAARTPVEIELSLEVVIAGRAVRGRVDAVFADGDGGVTIVDWKTGRPPGGASAQAAALQLSVYRVAYARWTGLPVDQVCAAFYYGATGETVRPELADESAIEALLRP